MLQHGHCCILVVWWVTWAVPAYPAPTITTVGDRPSGPTQVPRASISSRAPRTCDMHAWTALTHVCEHSRSQQWLAWNQRLAWNQWLAWNKGVQHHRLLCVCASCSAHEEGEQTHGGGLRAMTIRFDDRTTSPVSPSDDRTTLHLYPELNPPPL